MPARLHRAHDARGDRRSWPRRREQPAHAAEVRAHEPNEANPGAQRGLRNPEIAERLGVSLRLVEKRWKLVKALLFENLG